MRPFNHINASTVDEAVSALKGNNLVISGGTDLLGTLKDNLLMNYPATVVNVKSIPGMDYIKEEEGALTIGANTRLTDIAENPLVQEKYTALAQAARKVATPNIRNMGTIAGTIAQMPRCWYFRKSENRFPCLRKGGEECYAITGDNRYHSIFGGIKVGSSSCTLKCPAQTDIPGYFALIRDGRWAEAAERIMQVNPIPVVTSRVCAHFCQEGCRRCQVDEGVLISGVERALGDYILDNPERFYKAPETETGRHVAIVGSGPSGLAAAFYLRKAGNKVTVFDVKDEAGGMLMYAIPAYRLPKDTVRRIIKAFEGMGIVFKTNTRIGEDVMPEELERSFDSVLYATGTWKRPVVGISGEELTVFGLDFLVDVKKWMDGKIGSEVFVMGGGNVAMDVAVTAKRLGAKKVTLACLEPRDRMPASAEEVARAEEEGVVIMPGWGLSRVVEENGIVKGMELKRCISPWDSTGAFNPQYDENEKIVIQAENILMAVGQRVDLSFLDEKYQIQLNRRGLIDVEESGMTSRPGVFGAGDATTGPGTVIGAIATGHKAANGINAYLSTTPAEPKENPNKKLSFDHDALQMKQRALTIRELDPEKRSIDLEDTTSPTREEARLEAMRCLNCGCYAVSPSDVAPALCALEAEIVTNKRVIEAEFFFDARVPGSTVLNKDEIITEIRIPKQPEDSKTAFIKFSFRKAIDFPVVNCAVRTGKKPRIFLGAVAPVPYRAYDAEEVIAGKEITETLAEQAGANAVLGAQPYDANKYKVQLAKVMVKRALLSTVK